MRVNPRSRCDLWLESSAVAGVGTRVKITVAERTKLGSAETRRLRATGQIPGVIYGQNTPVAIAVAATDLRAALTTSAGLHAVLDVVVDTGASHSVVVKDYQVDKVRGTMTHIDLMEVNLDLVIQTTVHVNMVGEAPGAKQGGTLSHGPTDIHVEARPLDVPEQIDIDVSVLGLGDAIRISDLSSYSGVTFLDDPDTVLASVTSYAGAEDGADEGEGEADAVAEADTAEPEAEAAGDDAEADADAAE